MDEQYWNDLYSAEPQRWSGNPNGLLVTEAAGLTPGRALDIGCGEGADARWLADRGWTVTATDISQVALDRAAAAGGDITWQHADITVTPPPAGAFDLVTALYFGIQRQPDHAGLRGLLAAVAPGGTLLVGSHDLTGHEHRHGPDGGPPVDFSQYYRNDEIAALLDDTWTIVTNEIRDRVSPAPAGSGHVKDTVLVAQHHLR